MAMKISDLRGETLTFGPDYTTNFFRKADQAGWPTLTQESDGTLGNFLRINGATSTYPGVLIPKGVWPATGYDYTFEWTARYSAGPTAGKEWAFALYSGENHYMGLYHRHISGSERLWVWKNTTQLYNQPFSITPGQVYTYRLEFDSGGSAIRLYLDDSLIASTTNYTGWDAPLTLWMSMVIDGYDVNLDYKDVVVTVTPSTNKRIAGSVDCLDCIWQYTKPDPESVTMIFSWEEAQAYGGLTAPNTNSAGDPTWGYPGTGDFADPETLPDWVAGTWNYLYPQIDLPSGYQFGNLVLSGTQSAGYVRVHITDASGTLIPDEQIPDNSTGFYPQGLGTLLTVDLSGVTGSAVKIKVAGNYDGTAAGYPFRVIYQAQYEYRYAPSILHGWHLEMPLIPSHSPSASPSNSPSASVSSSPSSSSSASISSSPSASASGGPYMVLRDINGNVVTLKNKDGNVVNLAGMP